jgi:hypothetical protein
MHDLRSASVYLLPLAVRLAAAAAAGRRVAARPQRRAADSAITATPGFGAKGYTVQLVSHAPLASPDFLNTLCGFIAGATPIYLSLTSHPTKVLQYGSGPTGRGRQRLRNRVGAGAAGARADGACMMVRRTKDSLPAPSDMDPSGANR